MDTSPDTRPSPAMRGWPLTRERVTCRWNLNACGAPEMIWTSLMMEEQDSLAVPFVIGALDRPTGFWRR
jgi:hypothetical protein